MRHIKSLKIIKSMHPIQMKVISLSIVCIIVGSIVGGYIKFFHPQKNKLPHTENSITSVLKETDWNDYIWPTDASHWMTSNFCEFRANHFHAGIDISTNMQQGYNVFASRDGWLHEITFEPGGYGWYQVIRHSDGFYTCNAHLKGFPKKILDAYRKKQVELGMSYGSVKFEKNEVVVKKGEVIAFTGATGAGPPHLHFEIRDTSFNPVNPCLAKNLRIKDSIAPVIQSIIFQPLDALSSVDGKSDRYFFPTKSNSGMALPIIRGRVGIFVKAYDRAEESKDSFTPYKMELFIDAKKYFDVTFNRIQDSLYWYIRIDRDHELMKMKKGEYRKLFCEEGNLLSVYTPNDFDAGVISEKQIGAGKKNWKIVATDISGNSTSLSGTFIIVAQHNFAVSLDEQSNCRIKLDEPIKIASLDVEGKLRNGAWEKVKRFSGSGLSQFNDFQFDKNKYSMMKIAAVDSMQIPSSPVFLGDPANVHDADMQVERKIQFDEIIYKITTRTAFTQSPKVLVEQGTHSEEAIVTAISPSEYKAVSKAWEGFSGKANVKITSNIGGQFKQVNDSFTAFLISAINGGRLVSDDGKFSMHFRKGDVVRSLLCWVNKVTNDSLSAGYVVYPQEIPIAGMPTVSFALDSQKNNLSKYFTRAIHPAIMMKRSVSSANSNINTISARFGYFLASYYLLKDESLPTIDVSISKRKMYPVIFRLSDTGSGIDNQKIKLRIDGKLINAEYKESGKFYYVPSDLFKKNAKELTLQVTDRVGNIGSVVKKLR